MAERGKAFLPAAKGLGQRSAIVRGHLGTYEGILLTLQCQDSIDLHLITAHSCPNFSGSFLRGQGEEQSSLVFLRRLLVRAEARRDRGHLGEI